MFFNVTHNQANPFAIAGACLVFMLGSAFGQPAVSQTTETSLAELQKQWSEIDAKLVAKETELKSGEGDVPAIQKEFKALVVEADELIKKLESTAKSALKSEPENQEVVRVLMGIMLNDAEHRKDGKVLSLGDLLIANGINPEYFTIASRAERLSIPAREIFDELLIRHAEAMKADLPRVKLTTTKGDIVLELFENEAPNTVANFVSLVENETYTDLLFHRVVEGFMAQGGGFKMDGDNEVGGEGPGYEIKCECDTPDKRLHFSGSLSMAHRGKDTGGSQFFITFERTSFLDGRHTCFGRVVEGHDVLEMLARTHISAEKTGTGREEPIPGVTKDKIIKAEVIRKRDHEYRPEKVGGEEEKQEESTPELSAPEDTQDKGDGEKAEAGKGDEDKSKAEEKEGDDDSKNESKSDEDN